MKVQNCAATGMMRWDIPESNSILKMRKASRLQKRGQGRRNKNPKGNRKCGETLRTFFVGHEELFVPQSFDHLQPSGLARRDDRGKQTKHDAGCDAEQNSAQWENIFGGETWSPDSLYC